MKFIRNIYVLIIILRNARLVQNSADFTLEELKHISEKLNPVECMRLLEAIYSATPGKNHRSKVIRENAVRKWDLKQACLDELKTWNRQFPDKNEPGARLVMILHLNALGRSDLANWVRKTEKLIPVFINIVHSSVAPSYDEKNKETDTVEFEHRILKRDLSKNKPRAKKISHGLLQLGKKKRSFNQIDSDDRPAIAALTGPVSGTVKTAPQQSSLENGKLAGILSKNSMTIVASVGMATIFILGIIFFLFWKSVTNSPCPGNQISECCHHKNRKLEKGLQCIRFPEDSEIEESKTRCNKASQISVIDVEGGSCCHSVAISSRRSFSDPILCAEKIPLRMSVERLQLLEEEPVESEKEPALQTSCECRSLNVTDVCGVKPKKKKKKKKKKKVCEVKTNKEETKGAKNYLKIIQEKLLHRQRRKQKKNCTCDMKEFQDKILTIINKECGTCQCCNCTPEWEQDGLKIKKRRSNKKREVSIDSVKESRIKNVDKKGRMRTKKLKERTLPPSSSDEELVSISNINEKRKRYKSKRSAK